MAKQNIFDNEVYFEGYKKIRDNEVNANNLFEIPALRSLLPDLKGKRILDLGCGFGEHCVEFVAKGAEKVVGIDISEKMLALAREKNADARTCHRDCERWTRDEEGNKICLNIKGYALERENGSTWFVDDVKRYHRTFSTIVNTLIENGFNIDKMLEPVADEEILSKYPKFKDLFHKPDFLLIRSTRR